MPRLASLLIALAAFGVAASHAQTTAPAPAKVPTVKAVQPGLFEVAGPRVNEAIVAGITKITATPGKGLRAIHVSSPWGDSYHGWPPSMKQVPFTITAGKARHGDDQRPGLHGREQGRLQGRDRRRRPVCDHRHAEEQELDARLGQVTASQ